MKAKTKNLIKSICNWTTLSVWIYAFLGFLAFNWSHIYPLEWIARTTIFLTILGAFITFYDLILGNIQKENAKKKYKFITLSFLILLSIVIVFYSYVTVMINQEQRSEIYGAMRVFFALGLGIVITLYQIFTTNRTISCSKCGNTCMQGEKFCKECGTKLQ